jgi:hypothetical protein
MTDKKSPAFAGPCLWLSRKRVPLRGGMVVEQDNGSCKDRSSWPSQQSAQNFVRSLPLRAVIGVACTARTCDTRQGWELG